MKKLLSLFALVLTVCNTAMADGQTASQPNDEIWYTTTDGKMFELHNDDDFGADIKDHFYDEEKGCWVIKFNQSVTRIGDDTFGPLPDTNSLTSVSIPASVTSIGANAFISCIFLATLTFAPGSQLESIGANAFSYSEIGKEGRELTLPASVTTIEHDAFSSCAYLSKVYMSSEDLTNISTNAFDAKVIIHVPPYLHEKYKKHFLSRNTVETSLDEWKTYNIEPIKAAFETLTLISPSDKTYIRNIISNIYEAKDLDELNTYCDKAKARLQELEGLEGYVKSVLGSMGTKQSGPAVEIIGADGQTIKLYNIDKVNFSKVSTE